MVCRTIVCGTVQEPCGEGNSILTPHVRSGDSEVPRAHGTLPGAIRREGRDSSHLCEFRRAWEGQSGNRDCERVGPRAGETAKQARRRGRMNLSMIGDSEPEAMAKGPKEMPWRVPRIVVSEGAFQPAASTAIQQI